MHVLRVLWERQISGSVLTEELFVLVRGKVICWEELTSVGQLKCAVTLAWTFFWRSVLTSKTASILLVTNRKRSNRWEDQLSVTEWNALTCVPSALSAPSSASGVSGEDRHRHPRYPPVMPAHAALSQLWRGEKKIAFILTSKRKELSFEPHGRHENQIFSGILTKSVISLKGDRA